MAVARPGGITSRRMPWGLEGALVISCDQFLPVSQPTLEVLHLEEPCEKSLHICTSKSARDGGRLVLNPQKSTGWNMLKLRANCVLKKVASKPVVWSLQSLEQVPVSVSSPLEKNHWDPGDRKLPSQSTIRMGYGWMAVLIHVLVLYIAIPIHRAGNLNMAVAAASGTMRRSDGRLVFCSAGPLAHLRLILVHTVTLKREFRENRWLWINTY